MSNGRSGIRITSAPPASPECRAIQPAWRPITSTIITRLCDSAVVCSRSIASVAIWTAVSKPNVMSVPARSLSIVFGTPMTGRPCSPCSRAAAPSVSSPPIAIRPVEASVESSVAADQLGPVVALERVRARRAQDRAAARQDAARRLDGEVLVDALDRPAPAVAEADDLVAVVVDPPAHDRPDDRVQARAVASPREHADPHAGHDTQARQNGAPWDSQATSIWGALGAAGCALALPGCLGDGSRRAGPRQGRHGDGVLERARATACRPPPRARWWPGSGAHSPTPAGARAACASGCASCRPPSDEPDHPWDPALVSENAHRAADDPTAIAYLGELDYGATAVSLPITNDAGLLQVSPGDGLTSLTQRPPGRPRAGPERYYPSDRAQLRAASGPTDLDEAEWLVERVSAARRPAPGHGVRPRDLRPRAGGADRRARARGPESSRWPRRSTAGRSDEIPDIAQRACRGAPGRGDLRSAWPAPAPPGCWARSTRAARPRPLLASSGILAAGEALAVPSGPARIVAVGPALSPERAGYEAMRLVLDAVARAGATASA